MIIRKNYLYAAFAVAAFMLSSCKDNDEPEIPGSSLEAKSYTPKLSLSQSTAALPKTRLWHSHPPKTAKAQSQYRVPRSTSAKS